MPFRTGDIRDLAAPIEECVAKLRGRRAGLVAISGIDSSGKGYITARLAEEVARRGLNPAVINIDPWHLPQTVRFSESDPGGHFYRNTFRWDDFFRLLIEPLRAGRSIHLTTRLIEIARDRYYDYTYDFRDVDVILLEGIFVLKQEFRERYDLRYWVKCSFETALARALARNQEGLPAEEIVRDYRRIYFPAQRVHFAEDDPVAHADAIYENDDATLPAMTEPSRAQAAGD
jgi:uridine kinase